MVLVFALFSWTVAVVNILVYLSRNRLSPRFINKATMVEPIQGDEEILLQSRSKINKRKHG
jgi:hypothetical protein